MKADGRDMNTKERVGRGRIVGGRGTAWEGEIIRSVDTASDWRTDWEISGGEGLFWR